MELYKSFTEVVSISLYLNEKWLSGVVLKIETRAEQEQVKRGEAKVAGQEAGVVIEAFHWSAQYCLVYLKGNRLPSGVVLIREI